MFEKSDVWQQMSQKHKKTVIMDWPTSMSWLVRAFASCCFLV